jgi:hypothetical protein
LVAEKYSNEYNKSTVFGAPKECTNENNFIIISGV